MEANAGLSLVNGSSFSNGINTHVAGTVGSDDHSGGTSHGGVVAGVGGEAITHGGHAAEHGKIVRESLDASSHGSLVMITIGDNGLGGAEGVHGALVAEIRNGGVHIVEDLLGGGGLGHLEGGRLHHHGAGLVGKEVEAVDLADEVSSLGAGSQTHHEGSGKQSGTESFHGIPPEKCY